MNDDRSGRMVVVELLINGALAEKIADELSRAAESFIVPQPSGTRTRRY